MAVGYKQAVVPPATSLAVNGSIRQALLRDWLGMLASPELQILANFRTARNRLRKLRLDRLQTLQMALYPVL